MIKELFEIEPTQKNTLLSLIGISLICFLQLYLFKAQIFEKSALEIIGLSLGLTVCWSVLNLIPLFAFVLYSTEFPIDTKNFKFEKLIAVLGIIALCWITMLTYISYELKLCFKELIRIGIVASVTRTLFWFIAMTIKSYISKKPIRKSLKIPMKPQNPK